MDGATMTARGASALRWLVRAVRGDVVLAVVAGLIQVGGTALAARHQTDVRMLDVPPAPGSGAGRADRPAPLAGGGLVGGIRHGALLSTAGLSGWPDLDSVDRRVRHGAVFWPSDRGLHIAAGWLPVLWMAGEPGERPAASVRLGGRGARG